MQHIDLLVHGKWIITCEDNNRVLENHALAVHDGKILAILPSDSADKTYTAARTEYYKTQAIMPGLINAHTHIAMNYFRGLADDLELMDWLTQHIWPAEREWVSDAFVYDASELAMAEMIRGGTTCFNDMYFFLQATAKAAEKAGMRAHIGITVIDFPTSWAKDADDYFAKGLEFYQQYKNHAFITPTLAPHSTYTVSQKQLEKIKSLSDQYNLRVNIHAQESVTDVESAIKFNGKRPLQCLHEAGLINPKLIAIHMTQWNDWDFNTVASLKPSIVHCPESNMKLASGICPVDQLVKLGVNVALGTDGAASNNDLDMIGEMRAAALLGKMKSNDPKAVSAETVLKMATINGARALGIDHLTGSLTVGKAADFIAIDLETVETQPLYHPISQIVYATTRNQVTDVFVAGKQLLKHRQLTTLDEKEILKKAQTWRNKIKN